MKKLPKLVSADNFTIEELTNAYNQTRVDYMVPMPMNAKRLAEYVQVYDIDVEKSYIAMDGEQILGLGMLGVRPERTWITRLGILPVRRRQGAGEAVMRRMLEISDDMGTPLNILEVIKGNVPAHTLFLKLKFEEVRELLIVRRAPNQPEKEPRVEAQWVEKEQALQWLPERQPAQAWTNQDESIANSENIFGLQVNMNGSGRGWLTFQKTRFNLSRLMFHTEDGDPVEIMEELLIQLHSKFPKLDTYTENIPEDDPHYPAFEKLGYFEVFRRVEMYRQN
ncbi:MAG: GNAT family N-acetyltransferase [Anaerolineales bacterium]|nr:GNAT family N-acetyltransferase [Anaerolineales bacterium]